MQKPVLHEDADVLPLLLSLDLDRAKLIDCLRYADSERALCTGNDVHGFASMTAYDKLARALRETFCLDGSPWEKDETNNQAGIRNVEKKIKVVPCNFDEFTGNLTRDPSNRSPKGEVSKAKVRCNGTDWLPGLPDIRTQDGREYKTWILGIFSVPGEQLRGELSYPVAFDGQYYTAFKPRVILLRGDEPPAGRQGAAPAPTESEDIPISRKNR